LRETETFNEAVFGCQRCSNKTWDIIVLLEDKFSSSEYCCFSPSHCGWNWHCSFPVAPSLWRRTFLWFLWNVLRKMWASQRRVFGTFILQNTVSVIAVN